MYRYIVAMSEDRRHIQNQLKAASRLIDYHLIKLLLYPESANYSHWKQEILNFLEDIDTLKPNNKLPKYKFIKDALAVHNDVLTNYARKIRREYDEQLVMTSDRAVLAAVERYQDYLSQELSTVGVIDRNDAYRLLDQIVERYSGQ